MHKGSIEYAVGNEKIKVEFEYSDLKDLLEITKALSKSIEESY